MKHLLLIHDTAPDDLDRRAEFRDAHLALAWAAADRGELILGGALGDPVDGAALLFKAPGSERRRGVRPQLPLCEERPRQRLANA